MAKYLARSCPRCNDYLGIVMRKPIRNSPVQAINGRCLMWAIDSPGYLCKVERETHTPVSWRLMAKKTPDKTPSGPQLDILTAQKVFGWKKVHQRDCR